MTKDEVLLKQIDGLYGQVATRDAEIERLQAALKPFADCAEILEIQKIDAPDERMLMFASEGGGTFLGFAQVKDLRAARRALEQKVSTADEPSEVTVRRMHSEESPDRQ